MKIKYLTANEIYSINELVTGEIPHVRDRHGLQYAVRRPSMQLFGEEQFPTFYEKAAALLHGLAYHHVFVDGNKRTATLALTRFLESNGYRPLWTTREITDYVLDIAQGKLDIPTIAEWIGHHIEGA